jgi:cysteine-S-conjugate beta-lyase
MKYNFDEVIERQGTNCVKYDLRELIFKDADLLPMWVADMDFATPDFIRAAIDERLKHPILGYSIRPDSYYRSIIDWQKRKHNWTVQKEWIKFCPGIVPALNLCVQAFTEPGDKIIVQPPVYFPFFSAVTANGRKQIDNPLVLKDGRLCMDFDDLISKIDADVKMIIISNPHNPGGTVWTKEELGTLAEICLKNNILILSDEIHCDLVFQPNKHTVLANLSKEAADISITCIAPSKTFNMAGLATSSVIVSNSELQKKYDTILETMHIGNGNIFGTIASEAAYTNGDEWLGQLVSYLQGNIDFAIEFFKKKTPKIKAIVPESTYMIWLDCKELKLNAQNLNGFFIKEAKIGLNDGEIFGKGGQGFMRINVACPRSILEKGLNQIWKAIEGKLEAFRLENS